MKGHTESLAGIGSGLDCCIIVWGGGGGEGGENEPLFVVVLLSSPQPPSNCTCLKYTVILKLM